MLSQWIPLLYVIPLRGLFPSFNDINPPIPLTKRVAHDELEGFWLSKSKTILEPEKMMGEYEREVNAIRHGEPLPTRHVFRATNPSSLRRPLRQRSQVRHRRPRTCVNRPPWQHEVSQAHVAEDDESVTSAGVTLAELVL